MNIQSKDTKVDVPIEQKPKEIPAMFKGWNNRTEQSYIKEHLADKIPEALDFQEKHFLQLIDAEKYPEALQKEVTKIVRIKATDYSSKSRDEKEYVYWFENWYGRDWLNRRVPDVGDHIEGQYWEQETEPVYDRERLIGYNRSGQHEAFYIPFSKKAVDDIIAKSTINKGKIQFVVKFQDGRRNNQYTYDQFVNSSFEQCKEMMMHQGGPAMFEYNRQQQLKKDAEQLKQQKQYT